MGVIIFVTFGCRLVSQYDAKTYVSSFVVAEEELGSGYFTTAGFWQPSSYTFVSNDANSDQGVTFSPDAIQYQVDEGRQSEVDEQNRRLLLLGLGCLLAVLILSLFLSRDLILL